MLRFVPHPRDRARKRPIAANSEDARSIVEDLYSSSPRSIQDDECVNVIERVKAAIKFVRSSNRRTFGADCVAPAASAITRRWGEQRGACFRCGVALTAGSLSLAPSSRASMSEMCVIPEVPHRPVDDENFVLSCSGCEFVVRHCVVPLSVALRTEIAADPAMRDHYAERRDHYASFDSSTAHIVDAGLACSRYYGLGDAAEAASRFRADVDACRAACAAIERSCSDLIAATQAS